MHLITRRQFIKGSLVLGGSACCSAALGTLGSQLVWAQTSGGNGKTIVVIHLDGGNDWHQSFDIPQTHEARAAYEQVRAGVAVSLNGVRPTADGCGIHPNLSRVHALYNAGDVRIMRRVGTSRPSQSHDAEQLKFENGDIGNEGLGWMGRVMDQLTRQGGSVSRYMTVAIGQGNPIDIQGSLQRGLGLRDLSSYNLSRQTDQVEQNYRQYLQQQVLNAAQSTIAMEGRAAEGQKKMYDSIATLQNASTSFTGRGLSGNNASDLYPTQAPGPQLRQIAALIRAGLGTQLALCGMGGFDLHSEIGGDLGPQADLMLTLDRAIGAFMADMTAFGRANDVCVIVDSEFGRTLRANGSAGTDHGQSVAMLAVGGQVRGGVTGTPVSSDEFLVRGRRPDSIPVQHHFANVYEEALVWAGLPSEGVFGSHQDYRFDLFS